MKTLLLNIDHFLNDENFSFEAMEDSGNWMYFSKLSKLKNEFKNFLSHPIMSMSPSETLNIVNKYVIQIQRVRLVIDPDYSVITQIHGDGERKYRVIRAYWVDDNGERKRVISKCIGKITPETEKIISEVNVREVILDVLRKKYKKTEEKFGILV